MSGDRIRLTGLRVHGRHGVFPAERELGQVFVVDLELVLDLSAAARSDDVADTVHYGELAEEAAAIVAGEPVQLLERLADRIADAVLARPAVDTVTVTVHKPQAPIPLAFDDVSVSLSRSRDTRKPAPVVLALGSNLGDRAATLQSAVAALRGLPGFQVRAVSPVAETPAVTPAGVDPARPAYLNQVVVGSASLEPRRLLDALHDIERAHGRERAERWGDRTLDLDLITYGDERIETGNLQVPHPRAAERTFVLRPWLAVDPDAVLPGAGRVDALLAALLDAPAEDPR